MKKLRSNGSHGPTDVYLLTDEAARPPDAVQHVSGTVMKTFVPVAFRAEVSSVMRRALPRNLEDSPWPALQRDIPAAVRYVPGRLTGTDPHEKPRPETESGVRYLWRRIAAVSDKRCVDRSRLPRRGTMVRESSSLGVTRSFGRRRSSSLPAWQTSQSLKRRLNWGWMTTSLNHTPLGSWRNVSSFA